MLLVHLGIYFAIIFLLLLGRTGASDIAGKRNFSCPLTPQNPFHFGFGVTFLGDLFLLGVYSRLSDSTDAPTAQLDLDDVKGILTTNFLMYVMCCCERAVLPLNLFYNFCHYLENLGKDCEINVTRSILKEVQTSENLKFCIRTVISCFFEYL